MIRLSAVLVFALFAAFFTFFPSQDVRALDDSYEFANPPPPPDPSTLTEIGLLRPSYYWIALETNDGQPRNVPLLDMAGNTLQMVSQKFLTDLKMEGTGRLLNGKMVNFKGRVTKPDGTLETRWRWCGPEAPYGYGYEDLLLVPFKSVAVDPTVIPLGSRVYIPAVRGAPLPDGSIHDGIFYAIDIGAAIVDKKIDIFTSFGNQAAVFEKFGLETGKMTKIYLVK